MSDNIVGFITGVAVTALFTSLVLREEVDHIDVPAIMRTIEQCPDSKYHVIEVRAAISAYSHKETVIHCADGSTVKTVIPKAKGSAL